MSVISRNGDKDTPNNFKCNAKTHASTDKKNFIPLYAEHLHFILTRTSWLVTKICQHFTNEQSEFRKVFVVMNQNLGKRLLLLLNIFFISYSTMQILRLIKQIILIIAILSPFMMRSVKHPILKCLTVYLTTSNTIIFVTKS